MEQFAVKRPSISCMWLIRGDWFSVHHQESEDEDDYFEPTNDEEYHHSSKTQTRTLRRWTEVFLYRIHFSIFSFHFDFTTWYHTYLCFMCRPMIWTWFKQSKSTEQETGRLSPLKLAVISQQINAVQLCLIVFFFETHSRTRFIAWYPIFHSFCKQTSTGIGFWIQRLSKGTLLKVRDRMHWLLRHELIPIFNTGIIRITHSYHVAWRDLSSRESIILIWVNTYYTDEDEILLRQVRMFGTSAWKTIARQLPGRTGTRYLILQSMSFLGVCPPYRNYLSNLFNPFMLTHLTVLVWHVWFELSRHTVQTSVQGLTSPNSNPVEY